MKTHVRCKPVVLFAAFAALLFSGSTAEASSLYVSPQQGTYEVGQNFTVSVYVDADTNINAVTGVVQFPTSYLRVLRVNKNGSSIVNLWTMEPSFSNEGSSGNVTFEGVVLNPGFVGQKGQVLSMTFEVLREGSADISFARSSLLANDGQGTSLPVTTRASTYTLTKASPASMSSASKTQTDSSQSEPHQIVIIREVEAKDVVDYFWSSLPFWVRLLVVISIGVTSVIFGLIAASLGVLILIWIWSNIWHRKRQFFALIRTMGVLLRVSVRRIVRFSVHAERELWSDVRYSFGLFKREVHIARASRSMSFKRLLSDYFVLVGKIARRFVTTNT